MREINLIVLHCSATRVNQDFPIEALKACHKARGFKSVGYHYYITKDGTLYPCRPEREVGAHARPYNRCSIGICYEGGLDEEGRPQNTLTPEQYSRISELVAVLMRLFPKAEFLGHRDLPGTTPKECPCLDTRETFPLQKYKKI